MPGEKRAIQVSYSIADDATKQREIKALIKLSEVYSTKKLEIVTWDEESTIQENDKTIEIIPVWKWLLKLPFLFP